MKYNVNISLSSVNTDLHRSHTKSKIYPNFFTSVTITSSRQLQPIGNQVLGNFTGENTKLGNNFGFRDTCDISLSSPCHMS
jgi:hypothetical protein